MKREGRGGKGRREEGKKMKGEIRIEGERE